jgi:pyrroline-5-carboxylate reductase
MGYKDSIGFIGGGNMARALIGGIIRAGIIKADRIIVAEPLQNQRDSLRSDLDVRVTGDNNSAAGSGTIFLAVKPQVMPEVLEQIQGVVSMDSLVISIAAGITLSQLEESLPGVPVIRSMPNTPALIGSGTTVISEGKGTTPEMTLWATGIFESAGTCLVIPEGLMDAVTGLSGSGPAYIFRMAEAMTAAGISAGLPEKEATILVRQTIFGAARMMSETGTDPAQLREMVTSPGGTTEAGLAAMGEAGFEEAINKGIEAAVARAKELGK